MSDLKWLIWLLLLAALAGAAYYWYRRYGSPGRLPSNWRREPVLERALSALDEDEEEADGADGPGKNQLPAEPEPLPEMIVTLRLMARDPGGFPAEQLILALREHGLRHGKYGIFHAHDETEDMIYSVANLVEPGTFNLAQVKTDRYPGISLFLVLPGPSDPLEAFDSMISLGKSLALEFSGELLDEQGGILSVPRERYLREEIISSQRLES
jgi:FtsZ-interacting cell division protein ZipA